MSEAGKKRREKAAAASAAAQSGEKRRERLVRIIGAVVVVVVVVGIIAVAVVAKNSSSSTPSAGETGVADPNAPLPATVLPTDDERAYGVPFGTAGDDAPVLEIWEDFQCPACDAVEKANGAGIEQLAVDGKIKLVWRPTTFLDANLGNDSSARATAAWGCAIDLDKAREYHKTIFDNQPETEGDGYTDEDLISFAELAGITGADLDTFKTCFADRKYLPWAANSTSIFYAQNIAGTPTAFLNGAPLDTSVLIDQAALEQAVEIAAGGGAASPAASPSAS